MSECSTGGASVGRASAWHLAFVVRDGLMVVGHSNSSLQKTVWHVAALP
jgi:hypothetical protein